MVKLIQHHVKYKEIHGVDEIVLLTPEEHGQLHARLRREGKCNTPADELAKISMKAHKRTKKGKITQARQELTEKRKAYLKAYEQTPNCKARRAAYWQSEKGKVVAIAASAKYRAKQKANKLEQDISRIKSIQMISVNRRINQMNESALTVAQVAEELGASVGTVHILLKEERLKGFRLNRQWRINRVDLDKFRNIPGDTE